MERASSKKRNNRLDDGTQNLMSLDDLLGTTNDVVDMSAATAPPAPKIAGLHPRTGKPMIRAALDDFSQAETFEEPIAPPRCPPHLMRECQQFFKEEITVRFKVQFQDKQQEYSELSPEQQLVTARPEEHTLDNTGIRNCVPAICRYLPMEAAELAKTPDVPLQVFRRFSILILHIVGQFVKKHGIVLPPWPAQLSTAVATTLPDASPTLAATLYRNPSGAAPNKPPFPGKGPFTGR